MTQRLGIKGIRKSCSMALGDYGITPLEHTGGFATFANGGKRALPYAILDLYNSKGDLIYSRERDEPEAPQIVKPEVAAGLNRMMNKVVTDGTAQRASLEFTHAAGKTGTSSGPNDIWFVGFTGRYVASVWLGNDDNRPMAHGNTGGQIATPIWHDFMAVAHKDMNIPTIPGLQPHPVQLAEQERIAQLRITDPALAAQITGEAEAAAKASRKLPDAARDALRQMASDLRKAAGLSQKPSGDDVPPAPAKKPGDRAALPPASGRTAGTGLIGDGGFP
jgi:penicillin-binding protein 1A